MFDYNIPYLLLILAFLLLSLLERKEIVGKSKIRFFSGLFFFIFFGTRGLIGSDWYNYMYYFDNTSFSDIKIVEDFELGFSFLTKFLKLIGFNYNYYVLFITLIQTILFDNIIRKYSVNISLTYALFVCLFPLLIIDALRNLLSILIACQALPYIEQKKNRKAILIIVTSMFFHTTGVFFFLLFPFSKNYIRQPYILILLVIGTFIYFFQLRFFDILIESLGGVFGGRIDYLSKSVTKSDQSYGITFGIVEKYFFAYLLLKNFDVIKKTKILTPVFFNLFFIYIFIYLFFSTSESFINRFSLLFFIFYIVGIVNCIFVLKLYKQRIILNAVILLIFIKTFLTFNNILYDYSTFIYKKDDINKRETDRFNYYRERE
ncbi:EpsG family protein [Elizabethkingia ursingii]|uniref:EpsG family protein n=1 Tax=Elizabethkingia ursingii TaxID=1756150 RepID=UPI00201109F9|nr:EpsG family protein [Elizabethkingia ursingii]MCL1669433.1 EpsG family protein [Elizabethkingia ursingii]